ncbi:MAG TPA: YegS/Rv2252/BmrU family lipid kinase [bacterium]|nr:YegS/Rv2252/BmrU family lipid kinase [bacterium]HPN43706.1 YegS/Rv2252/BmrU family lipid kinase [bacterium]
MPENTKWAFIINPIAGNGYAKKFATKVQEKAEQHGLVYTLVFTERKGHAIELARNLAGSGYTNIIAVGGDGTMNETITGIMDQPVTFGAIPAGTGNDFVPILGFHERFTDDDWDEFFKVTTTLMDVGVCNGHYFVNGMGLGFDAQVAAENYKNGQVKKGYPGKYLWHIIKTLLFFQEKPMTIISGKDEISARCFINTIGIGRRFGGGYFLTPKAIANDGLFDILHVEKLTFSERFNIFDKVKKGVHLQDPKVQYYTTDKLLIQFNETVPYHLDGEMFYGDRFIINILPAKIKTIYNSTGAHYLKIV